MQGDDGLRNAAQRLIDRGEVLDVRILQAGRVITGVVDVAARYRVYIHKSDGGGKIEGECNCGAPDPCVHVAAVLLAAATGAAQTPPEIHRARQAPPLSSNTSAHGAPSQQRLYYLLEFAGVDSTDGFRLSVWVGQSAGQIQSDTVCPFSPRSSAGGLSSEDLPRYVDAQDREILQTLAARHIEGPWELRDAAAADLLHKAIASGRAYWQALRGAPLQFHDLISVDETLPQPPTVQKQPLSSLKGKLALSADLKARLQFVYNGHCIDSRSLRLDSLRSDRNTVSYRVDPVLYEVDRDLNTERCLQTQLNDALKDTAQDRGSWLAFMMNAVPLLKTDDWEVAVDPAFPYRIATPGEWYGDLHTNAAKSAGREWFDLRLGVRVDGHPVNLLPALVAYLQADLGKDDPSYCRIGDYVLLRLDDGRWLPIAIERIQRIAGTLVELFDRDVLNERFALALPINQASRLAPLARDLNEAALQSNERSVFALIEELKDFSGIAPLAPPAHFQATLRPYQQEGLGWLQFLRRHRLGGILADDMGLGKTVQTLAHLTLEKEQGRLRKPSLIVAPVSVIGNWQQEISRFAPQLKQLTLHGARRQESFAAIDTADVVITGYPQLQLDIEFLLAREFCFVILDEAQTIKNPRAKVSQAACMLRAEHRLCLTGTPMENHLGELWSLFDFLQPGLLGDEKQFQRHYRTPIEKRGDRNRAASLTRRIAPFALRRTKDAVAKDLPPKTQIVESIVMDDRQRDFYDGIRLAMHRRVREVIEQQGLARSHITVLDALLKLRQACCDPRLVKSDATAQTIPSAKLEWLSIVLPELVAEGRRILLFSQFTSMLRLIETAVTELSIPYLMLTGATQHRTALVERFQAGEAPLFLISLKAGGAGLNLTAADTVIHYDPWWNPAVEAQATDRAHRIGQDKPVFVYKLIAQGTVEEKIMQLQADKHALASRLYTERNASPAQWSAADMETLFAP
jgi:superfamily II DNA or RNA helicase